MTANLSPHRNTAKSNLAHYFKLLARQAGVHWDYENTLEVETIVDSVIEAAKDEIRRELYEIALEEFSEQIANNRLKVCALPGCGVLHSRKGKYCSTRCTNLAAQRAKRERDRVRKAGATP